MIDAAVLRAMAAAGATTEVIIAAVEAAQAADEARKEAKRAGNAERQQRFRDRRKERKETRNKNNALRDVTPPIDNNHTPSDISPDGENHKAAFPKPDWAEVSVWGDFLKNRKRKRLPNTATAHKAFLADIARLADGEWPPGRLLEHATAKGWGAIYDPRPNFKPNGNTDGKPAHCNDQAPRNPYVRAVIAGQAARAADERGQSGSWSERSEAAF